MTKSGTNTIRGSGLEFHRNSALDSRNSFDLADPPDFIRNQFGGTLGGPVQKNRLFFFGSYEGLRDRRSVTRYAKLPNAAAHRGLVPDADGRLQEVGVNVDGTRFAGAGRNTSTATPARQVQIGLKFIF